MLFNNLISGRFLLLQQVPNDIKLSVAPNVTMENNNTVILPYSNSEDTASKTPVAAARVTSPPEQGMNKFELGRIVLVSSN